MRTVASDAVNNASLPFILLLPDSHPAVKNISFCQPFTRLRLSPVIVYMKIRANLAQHASASNSLPFLHRGPLSRPPSRSSICCPVAQEQLNCADVGSVFSSR